MDENINTQPNNEKKNSMYAPMIAVAAIVILALAAIALFSTNKAKNDQLVGVTPSVNETQNEINNIEPIASPMPTKSTLAMPTTSQAMIPTGTVSASPVITPVTTVTPSTTISAGTKEFTVLGSNYKFEPTTLTVKKGDTVKITFKNTGGFHDFVIDEFTGAKTKQLQDGGMEVISFVADKTGTFEFYCSVGKHREMGMKGTLVVN